MPGDDAVYEVGSRLKAGKGEIRLQPQAGARIIERSEHGFGAGAPAAVRFHQLNRLLISLGRDFRIILPNLLRWGVVDTIARHALPALNPRAAKTAVTVKNEEGFFQ